jgi:hypothetical protein
VNFRVCLLSSFTSLRKYKKRGFGAANYTDKLIIDVSVVWII